MRNNKILFLILPLTMFFMQCCNTTKGEVRDVAQKYLDATGRYDVTDACRYCTPETAKGLRQIEISLLSKISADTLAKNMPAKIKIKSIELTSDSTAIVTYHKHTPIDNFDGTLDMVLRNNQWMAHIGGIAIPEMVQKAANNETIYFNYDSIHPGDLKAVRPNTRNNDKKNLNMREEN